MLSHHCNEVAQAQAFLQEDEWAVFPSYRPSAHFWSKDEQESENFITVREMLEQDVGDEEGEGRDISADCFHVCVPSLSPNISFSDDRMDAKAEILKFHRFLERLRRHNTRQG